MFDGLTDIPGLKIGHWTDLDAGTGCTVILCPEGAVAGVDVRGAAPGTRETDLLDPLCMVQEVHAILIGGGSAYGLAAADGVMRWLEEHGYGFDVRVAKVPIVPAAILFDLALGRADIRPDAAAGYTACVAATGGLLGQGTVGAGTGATIGKSMGFAQAMKGGLGMASHQIPGGVVVAAMAAVNPLGEVRDPNSGEILAGARNPTGGGLVDAVAFAQSRLGQAAMTAAQGANTTLGVIATNAKLTKVEATKVAQMAHNGFARTIRPVHTSFDGDTIFALSYGQVQADVNLIGTIAADVMAQAIVNGVKQATSLHGIPSLAEWRGV